MAIGKNKRGKGKKGAKRKLIDPFTRKEWYDVKAPSIFKNTDVGHTLVTRTTGTKLASEGLRGRVFEVSLGDLNQNEDDAHRIIRLCVEDIQGKNCLTNFHGMRFSTDKLKSLVRKWQTIIEAYVDVKTTDGYALRLFCIGFTKRRMNQRRKTSYAQSAQIRQIRKKMVEVMRRESQSSDLKTLFEKFVPEVIRQHIIRETHGIYPLQNLFVRKAKILKKPRFDLTKLMEVHSGHASTGTPVPRDEPAPEPTEPAEEEAGEA